jgi:hypothetical protein
LDEEIWDATVFTKNRDRLLEAEVAKQFLAQVVEQARAQHLTSDGHFSVNGTLLEAWAGVKSFQRREGSNPPSSDDHDPGNSQPLAAHHLTWVEVHCQTSNAVRVNAKQPSNNNLSPWWGASRRWNTRPQELLQQPAKELGKVGVLSSCMSRNYVRYGHKNCCDRGRTGK